MIPPALLPVIFFLPPLVSILLPFLVPVPKLHHINNDAIPFNSRVALLIAHPDDEAMFFSPTLLALTSPERANIVDILCLTDGNAAGLGHIRSNELHASAARLGVGVEDPVLPGETPTPEQLPVPNPRVTIINDPARFPDDMKAVWNASDVADVLRKQYVAATNFHPRKEGVKEGVKESVKESVAGAWSWFNKKQSNGIAQQHEDHHADNILPATNIDYLITFDDAGVSSHPNHISLNHGATEFIRQLQRESGGERAPPHVPRLYTLATVNILRKYTAMLDILTTRFLIGSEARDIARKEKAKLGIESFGTWVAGLPHVLKAHATTRDGLALNEGNHLMVQNNVVGYRRAREAMLYAHKSQMVWFRHGWIALSRYMYVNDLKRVYVDEE